eukprot:847100_1
MSSRTKKKPAVTVNRSKALRFITQQAFWQIETNKSEEQKVLVHKEVNWARNCPDNDTYAREICSFIVNRHIKLLQQSIQAKKTASKAKQTENITKHSQMQQNPQFYIDAKIKEFYAAVGISPRYHYSYELQDASQAKRAKLSHSNTNTKTESAETVKLPSMLLNSTKLQHWLEDKLDTLKEYETLIKDTELDIETSKNCIRNLRRDIDILKSTVLQQSSHGLRENVDLKRVYLDIQKMEKSLPQLRRDYMKPFLVPFIQQFESCDVKQTMQAQKGVKQLLYKHKFEDKARQFCTVYNRKMITHLLYESENDELNDDLDLLRDFGVKFEVEKERNGRNIRIIFEGHFGEEVDEKWKPPNLVIIVNESKYKHRYPMLQTKGWMGQKRLMDFVFELKAKRGIKRDRMNDDDDDVKLDMDAHKSRFEEKHIQWLNRYKANTLKANGEFVSIVKLDMDAHKSRFEEKHIQWLNRYKANTLKANGEFVSIVNVYNFYTEAVKVLINQMCHTQKR